MECDEIRAMAQAIYGTDKPRGEELRSWLFQGRMSASQLARVGRSDPPPCFESERQWIAWCIHEAARPILGGSSYCYDCTPAYHQAMNRNGKCEHPLTTFRAVGQPPVPVGQRDRRRAPPR